MRCFAGIPSTVQDAFDADGEDDDEQGDGTAMVMAKYDRMLHGEQRYKIDNVVCCYCCCCCAYCLFLLLL